MSERDKKRRIGIKRFFRKPYRKHHHYEPFYDAHADYNTNAKSYYDYLARFNYYIHVITDAINRLLNRDIEFTDTKTIDFTKRGDWIDNGDCEPDNYDDVLNITADVKVSKETESYTIKTTNQEKTLPNAIKVKNDGLFVRDYTSVIGALDDELKKVINRVDNLENKFNGLESGLQKIVDNLYKSGAITSNNINNFEFKNNRDIATGNINLFGGNTDGNSFIRTNSGQTENDITAGY